MPSGPAARILRDPGAALAHAVHAAVAALHRARPESAATAAVALTGAVVAAVLVRRRRALLTRGGRIVTILSPPEVEPGGADALWRNLHDLLRPRWKEILGGQPHLSFEYTWSAAGVRISIWVPEAVPPGLVERAVEAAWPAARTQTTPAARLLPEGGFVAGGKLRLAAPECFSLADGVRRGPHESGDGRGDATLPG